MQMLSILRSSYEYPWRRSFNCCLSPPTSAAAVSKSQNFQDQEKKTNKTEGDDNNKGISKRIKVGRQRYIPVSKSQLEDALLSFLRDDDDDDDDDDSVICHFLLLSSCLDSILHAQHKRILEEMRDDYFSTQSVSNQDPSNVKSSEDDTANLQETQLPFLNGLGFIENLSYCQGASENTSQVAAATRFQRSFMKLLENAQFQQLSVRDLMLTSALNTDYLLTLPIYVDWKRAPKSNAIIFRRGYSTEKQKGLLIVEKLDYLQSKVLQEIFNLISKPMLTLGLWIKEAIQSASEKEDVKFWIRRAQLWLQELSLLQQSLSSETRTSDAIRKFDHNLDEDLPIWLAAQEAVSRYEVFLSSIGPRGRLLRKFLGWIGILPPTPEISFKFDSHNEDAPEPHLRPVQLSRITLNDIWTPATRKHCGNNLWAILKVGFSIIFSQSTIQEPTFQELILLYAEETVKAEIPSWQLKIYENIPVPDLSVIFPHKKLSFRILDTVRLDVATVVGLLAYFINYKFEDVLSSPSAIMLDVIAVSALIIFVIRVALGYKQTWDRYQLLVNKTLYEKTLASGFGSVHFLLDASEQQQYKECILAYGILLKAENTQYTRSSLREECERFLYNKFKEKVQMPVNKAVDMLINFGLVLEHEVHGKNILQVVPCSSAYDALRKRWDCLLL